MHIIASRIAWLERKIKAYGPQSKYAKELRLLKRVLP